MMMKLKGATLMEVIVAMITGSILISMTFLCFDIAVKHFNLTKRNLSAAYELQKLFSLINEDCFESSRINLQDNVLLFERGKHSIKYIVNSNHMVRIQELNVDTFKYTMTDFRYESLSLDLIDKGIVKTFSFRLIKEGEDLSCSFSKRYDANTIIELINENN